MAFVNADRRLAKVELQFQHLPRGWRLDRNAEILCIFHERTGGLLAFTASDARSPSDLTGSLSVIDPRFGPVGAAEEGECEDGGRYTKATILHPQGATVTVWNVIREGHVSYKVAWVVKDAEPELLREAERIALAASPPPRFLSLHARGLLQVIRSHFEADGYSPLGAIHVIDEKSRDSQAKVKVCPVDLSGERSRITEEIRMQRKALGSCLVALIGQGDGADGEWVMVDMETRDERRSYQLPVERSTLGWAVRRDKPHWRICDLFVPPSPHAKAWNPNDPD